MLQRQSGWALIFLLLGAVLYNSGYPAWFAGYFAQYTEDFPAGGMVHIFSGGDGQVVLLQCAGDAALIGGGPEGSAAALLQYLSELGIQQLAAVVVGDTSYDHTSGLKIILDQLAVAAFYDASNPIGTPLDRDLLAILDRIALPYQRLRAGQKIMLSCMELQVIAPLETAAAEEGIVAPSSANSGVFIVTGASHKILVAGNMDSDDEKTLVRVYPQLKVEVLLVARGGHKSATSKVFLEHIQPQLAIIAVGGYNEEGRPHAEVLQRLHEAGVRILRTDRHGTVVLSLSRRGLYVNLQPHLPATE